MPGIYTISHEQVDRLYWLGRYTERVYTLLCLFNRSIDRMLDRGDDDYIEFCARLSIPHTVYKDHLDFEHNYLFDAANPDSVYSNLSRAYDNAIVMRNVLTTETLAYLQLALNRMEIGRTEESALLETQYVIDLIHAFWGAVDENVVDSAKRDLLKAGKYAERADLYLRLAFPKPLIQRTLPRLLAHTRRVEPLLHPEVLACLEDIAETAGDAETRFEVLRLVNAIH